MLLTLPLGIKADDNGWCSALSCQKMELTRWGNIIADKTGTTNLPGIFAGGDIIRGGATVILAMGDGKRAAAAIDEYLATK